MKSKILGGLMAAVMCFSGCACQSVESGNVGLKKVWGEVEGVSLDEGLVYYNPISTDIVQISTRIQKHEARASASSKDLQVVTAQIALNYRLDAGHIREIYTDIGDLRMVERTIIEPALAESTKKSTALYTAEQLITRRAEVKRAITEDITATLKKNHIMVTEMSITDFKFDEKYQDAVEAKQVAEQKAAQAKNDLDRIRVEAEQREAEALGQAKATVAKAKGDAQATIARAEAEAEAQRLLRKTITPEIVQLRAIEKWDGKQPEVVSGKDGGLLVNLGKR